MSDENGSSMPATPTGTVPRGRKEPTYIVDVLVSHERGTGGTRHDLTVEDAARSFAGVMSSEAARESGLTLRGMALDDRPEGESRSTIVRAVLGLMLEDAPDGVIRATAAVEGALVDLNTVSSIRSGNRRLEAFVVLVERSPALDFPEEQPRRRLEDADDRGSFSRLANDEDDEDESDGEPS